jgi:PKD repeat protein
MFNGPPPTSSLNWKAQWETENFALTPTDLPPTGDFTSSGTSADTPVTFTAQASDPDGTIASYLWDFGDGSTGTGATTSHLYGTGGTFSVTLTVTDNGGKTVQVSHQVTVTAGS